MALGIYKEANNPASLVTSTNPIETTHRGNIGDSFEIKLYVRNDDVLKFYESIVIQPKDDLFPDDTKGDAGTGWGIKLRAGDEQPTSTNWRDIKAGSPISLEDIGTSLASDTDSYIPFWYRIESPSNISVETKEDIKLLLGYLEYSIP